MSKTTAQPGVTRSRQPLRQTMLALAVAIAGIVLFSTMATSASAASLQPIDEGGRLVPVGEGTKRNLESGNDLYQQVDEYPRIDGDSVSLDASKSAGFHRIKFGVMNRNSNSVCVTVRAKATSTDGQVRVALYSNSTLVWRGEWRDLSNRWDNYMFGADSSVNLTGKRLVAKVEMRRNTSGGNISYSQVFARLDCDEWVHAKLLGYAFGDGSYTPYSSQGINPTLSFLTKNRALATDFIELGCVAGYTLSYKDGAGVDRNPCDGWADLNLSSKRRFKIANFSFPQPTFQDFAEQANSEQQRAFLSGMIPTEGAATLHPHGSPRYLVDDQLFSGAYKVQTGETDLEACDRIDPRMIDLRTLMENGDFADDVLVSSAPRCRNDGDDRDEITAVYVTENAACKFNSKYGYEFATFGRVPGASGGEPGACP